MEVQNLRRQAMPVAGLPKKLHTIHGGLRGRIFEGQIELGAKLYHFSYVPAGAVLFEQRLVLNGRLLIDSSPRGTTEPRPGARRKTQEVFTPSRSVDGVTARLLATQGGVGGSPVRRQLLTGTAQTGQTATSDQKLEQEKGPETELQPGLHAFESPKPDKTGRPTVDSTGPLSFVGVLYFLLSPLDGHVLGVPLDLSRVQFNARLAPTDDLGRDLQFLFSDVVGALYGEPRDEKAAAGYVAELNRMLH